MPIGFRDDPNPLDGSRTFTWNSKHRENRIGAEALMITGDGNLVDIQADIRYRVVEPRPFLFGVNDCDELLAPRANRSCAAPLRVNHFTIC